VLGTAQLGGHSVALPVADARYHLHVLGATGSGKTTLLTDMIIQDINAGRGIVVMTRTVTSSSTSSTGSPPPSATGSCCSTRTNRTRQS
jgi:hypothetical protein